MAAEQLVLEEVVDEFGWRVVIALYLVADDVRFVLYLVLWILTAEDDIRQQVNGTRKVLLLDGCIEGGVLLVGKGVQVAAHTLQAVQYLDGRTASGALEAHVLAKVCHAFFACRLMARPCGKAYATINH
jgi:hypothetical protein